MNRLLKLAFATAEPAPSYSPVVATIAAVLEHGAREGVDAARLGAILGGALHRECQIKDTITLLEAAINSALHCERDRVEMEKVERGTI